MSLVLTGGAFSGTIAEKGALTNIGGWSCTSPIVTAILATALKGLSDWSVASKLMTYEERLSKSSSWFRKRRTWYSFGVI